MTAALERASGIYVLKRRVAKFSSNKKVGEVIAKSEGNNRCRLQYVVATMG